MKNITDIENLEVLLIKMFENESVNPEDYNLISKYLAKAKNDFIYNS